MNLWRIFSGLMILVLCSVLGQAEAQVTDGEREALIRLYDATGGDQWKLRMGWRGARGTECQWYGIVCNPGDGEVRHVTQILLTDNGLTGSLPASLGELEHLDTLRLSRNALQGTMPGTLWHLNQLRSLSLAENNLLGQIPGALLDHPMLSLNLSGNRFSGFSAPGSTPHWPSEPRSMQLADNRFQELPPAAWREHGRIKLLDLSGNQLGPILDLDEAPWPELETLRLSGNDIEQVHNMASSLLPDLRILDLSDNRIEPWPLADATFEKLEQLKLNLNKLNELPDSLLELEQLETLNLGSNQLAGELPEWFAELSLLGLGLGNNELEGPIDRLFAALDVDSIVLPQPDGPPGVSDRLRLHAHNNPFDGSLPDDLDYRKFNSPYGLAPSAVFGLDLCFTDVELPAAELLDEINPVQRGHDLEACIGRQRVSMDLEAGGSWFDPSRAGEGLTQMLLTDGQLLTYWFTYAPEQATSTDQEGQTWMLAMASPGESWVEHTGFQIPQGGRFSIGLEGQRPQPQRWSATTRQDRTAADEIHFSYQLNHGSLCIAWGCSHNVKSGRHDLMPLTRLAGTRCDNQQPNQALSGAWYNPDANGEGFIVEVLDNGRGVVYWFTSLVSG
ncbi:hypothetical protein IC757_01760 [Wenzhouxiangella sp. AB-CW3]|uniref:leucine-rich repeat domain-containing protein n=1 Tax=Wenzhouxiangella sp. AB-CW3 TaxID=2771012 RepID=UPI00168B14A3|nr:hypothetical protein [Wenzhouxiangella sp. AB-CW3]QOC22913.1 hypothetical protein IC757_01760 [Wenzhouxiangella sp. AB-CW3]